MLKCAARQRTHRLIPFRERFRASAAPKDSLAGNVAPHKSLTHIKSFCFNYVRSSIPMMKSAFLLFVAVFSICATSPVYADSSTITVGAISILTGESSNIGHHARQAAEMAIDEINGSGGVNGKHLKLIWEDERDAKAEPAVTAYKKLTTVDHVNVIFGPGFQDAMMALAPMAKRDNRMLITPSTPSLGLSNVFSTWIDPKHEANLMAQRIFRDHKRVSVLAAQQSWELMVAEEFKTIFSGLGGTVASYHEPLTSNKDLRSEVARVKQVKPDAILVTSYTLFPAYLKTIRQQGLTCPVFMVEADNALVTAAGESAEGVISIGPDVPSSEFDRRYSARYGEAADIPAHQSYDAVNLLAQALRQNGESTENILRFFKEFKSYDGVSGRIFNDGDSTKTAAAFFRVENGKLKRMK